MLKLKKTRSCLGCRARGGNGTCSLGFLNRGEYVREFGLHLMKPKEPCYKPLTIPELIEAEKLIRNK